VVPSVERFEKFEPKHDSIIIINLDDTGDLSHKQKLNIIPHVYAC